MRANKPRKPRRGFVPPGYKYLGPGNDVNLGTPTNPSDAAAQAHDIQYTRLQRKFNPYITYNDADEDMLLALTTADDWGGIVAHRLFNNKRKLAERGWLPDIDFDHSSLRGSKKQAFRPKATMSAMDVDTGAKTKPVNPQIKAGITTQQTSGGNQETAISYQKPHYGLANTITAVLPSTVYFSILTPTSTQGVAGTTWNIRLTSLLDQVIDNTVTPAGGGAFSAGRYNRIIPTGTGTSWPTTPLAFPSGVSDDMQWRKYYNKMYQYYVVLGVEWELTMVNPHQFVNNNIVMGSYIDTYSTTNASTVHPIALVSEMEYWSDVRWTMIHSTADNSNNGNVATARGYYKPGLVKQNVENDEDIKTWTKTGATPALTEKLTFVFNKAWNNDNSLPTGVNCRLKFRYIVQFKDLYPQYRWPSVTFLPIVTTTADILAQ